MTLRHLKIFVTVCEEGTMTAAGEKLYIAQPSISLAISELEEYYGVKLFDRISKRLHLTQTGELFLQYATHIVSLFDEMEQSVRNSDSIGTLRLGASITAGNYLMPGYVQQLKKKYPELTIEVSIGNSEMIEKQVANNEIDAAIIEGMPQNLALQSEHLMTDPLVFICNLEHPFAAEKIVPLEALREEDFLLREKGSAVREIFDSHLSANGLKIKPLWESVSTQALVRGVKVGLGLSALPFMFVREELEKNEIATFKVEGIYLERNFSIIYHKNKFFTQSLKDFICLCKDNPNSF